MRSPEEILDAVSDSTDPDLAIEKVRILQAKVDPERFDYFYVQYYPRIFRFFYHRFWHLDVAEDLTGETFYRALKNLWRFRWQGVSFGAWLFRIAVNQARQHARYCKRHPEEPLPKNVMGEDLLAGNEPDPVVRLEMTQAREQLAKLMARLDEDDQNFMTLFYRDSLSTREIAVIAGLPRGTVASRINRGYGKLQRMVEADYERG